MTDHIITIAEVRAFLKEIEGQEISLDKLRSELGIEKYDPQGNITKSFNTIRVLVHQLEEHKLLRYVNRGLYMVVKQVEPVQVFGIDREERPLFPLVFPRDIDTMMEMDFAKDVVIREGDLVTVGGVKSVGKTHLALNFIGENINIHPVLMGNEYTIILEDGKNDVAQRFYKRLKVMSITNADNGGWIEWRDEMGNDKFTLLPVDSDYAEHIVKNRLNIIDWIDLDGSRLYDIGHLLKGVKKNLGRGVGIVFLQKSGANIDPRGGQFVRDYSDLEIILDNFGDSDVLLTIRGCKEMTAPILGKTYAYHLSFKDSGTQTHNFREVKKCPACKGTGYTKQQKCEMCWGLKFVEMDK